MNKHRLRVLGFLGGLLLAAAPGWAAPTPRAQIVRHAGTVRVQRGGQGSWLTVGARPDCQLYSADQVQTYQQSSATIAIDGNRVELGPRTRVIVPDWPTHRGANGGSRLRAITGKLLLWIIGGRDMEVGTPGAVAAASGTKFVIEVGEDEVTTLTVLEGQVVFHNDLGSVAVAAGEQSKASVGSAPTRPMAVDPSAYLQWEASLESIWMDFENRHNPAEPADRLKQTAEDARRQADANPADADAQVRAGDLLHDAGDLSAAETYYRKALELAPGSQAASVSLAYTLLAQGHASDAEAAFEAASKAAPTSAAPLVGWAAARLALGERAGAATPTELLTRAFAIEPQNALAHTVAGLVAIRQGDAEAARRSLNQALAADPDCFQAHCYLSLVELAGANAPAAVTAARRAVELAPASSLAHQSLATASLFAGDVATAKTEAASALEANPSSPGAHLVLSDLLVTEGELTDAAQEARQALALDPGFAPAYAALGMIALAQNDLKTADTAFARALELSPKLVAARTGMGVTYARQGKLGQAMEMQKAAIALDSRSAATHNNLGGIHLARGDLDQAVAEFKAAVELQPDWSMPHANLAIAYLDLNQFAEAVHEGELAARLGEDSARVYTTLGRVYLEQNRVNKAWAALRRAVELDDTYALVHFELAEVYLRLGRARDARREQLEAIALQPAAMLETRDYARTEARVEVGSFDARLRTDGRQNGGQTSYFLSAEHEINDWDRPHSQWNRTTVQGILGYQPSADRAAAVLVTTQDEDRDQPGRALAGGAPEDPDYQNSFDGREGHVLARVGSPDRARVTLKLGFRNSALEDNNPDSLLPDPKPFRRLDIRLDGPLAEARMDKRITPRDSLTAGVAVSGEKREVSGIVGTPNPPGAPDPVAWTPFSDEVRRNAATFYLEHQHRLGDRTRLMVGGRIATTEDTRPVLRPKAWLHQDLGNTGSLILLTRPVLRDDVSELSPVDDWALTDGLSPLDFSAGGFGQSYELQYQLMPKNGSLLRVSGFHRTLRNLLVDLSDPAWAPGEAGTVLGSATLQGAEAEYECWLTRDLSVGAWARYADSDNDDTAGLQVPFQPEFLSSLRLDYLSRSGLRAGVRWRHIGSRYVDLANTLEADAYDVVDLSAAYQVDLRTDLFLNVDNLFDTDDGFWPGYPDRGRWIRGGVEYRF